MIASVYESAFLSQDFETKRCDESNAWRCLKQGELTPLTLAERVNISRLCYGVLRACARVPLSLPE